MPSRPVGGFTLIELLVVIAIIGILSSVALVPLGSARSKARDARRASDVRQIQLALEIYAAGHGGQYPCGTTSACDVFVIALNKSPGFAGAALIEDGAITTIPADPLHSTATCNATGGGYCYCSNGSGYVLTANTENDKGGSDRCYVFEGNLSSFCQGHVAPGGTWATQPCSQRF